MRSNPTLYVCPTLWDSVAHVCLVTLLNTDYVSSKLMKLKKEKFEIEEKIEDILSKIVSNPNFVPLATAFALSTAGITLSLSGADHSHMAFAVKHAAGCHHGTGICPTHAIFWLRDK